MTDEDVALRAKVDEVRDRLAELEAAAEWWKARYEGTLAMCREHLARALTAERKADERAIRMADLEHKLACALVLAAEQRRMLARAIGFANVREFPVIDAEYEEVSGEQGS